MRNFRLWGYLVVALALVGLAVTSPNAWATPDQTPDRQGQTVPTARPPATTSPFDPSHPTPLPPSAVGNCSPLAPPTPQLLVVGDRTPGRPGATLQFTATVVNQSAAVATGVTLEVILSEGLDPNPLRAGVPGTWSGRTLHVEVATLDPGQTLVVPFSVTVSRSATPGSVLQIMTRAAAAGGWCGDAQSLIPLPPAELPRTGGE